MSKPKVLRFGIRSLDKLIGTMKDRKAETDGSPDGYGIDLSELEEAEGEKQDGKNSLPITSSVCLAGPDGTGKSVLSLHMSSRYLADCLAECVETCPRLRVLYISTDLTYKMALKGWKHFALDRPLERREPLLELKEGSKNQQGQKIDIGLKQYFPSGDGNSAKSIVNYLEGPAHTLDSDPIKAEVCFVDLASRTAGDDWGFVHHLLSTLEEPRLDNPRHLVVLDAVEGFETLVGDLNAFGEKSSRRARIAQVMRLTSGKCHLLLVVEEGHKQRFPEEFVTDVVIRLRNVETGRYLRRTVEIEKARGQWHRRGQHPYVIRDGRGSTTGDQTNADDPEVFRDKPAKKYQSYVHVFPSLDYTSREIMIDKYNPRKPPTKARFAAFGIPFLDNMLGGSGEKAERKTASEGDYDTRGLPCGSATALLGDSLTQKSQLGKAFLSRAFYSYAKDLWDKTKQLDESVNSAAVKRRVQKLSQQICKRSAGSNPVTLLFTTQDLNRENLAAEFYQWLRDDESIFGRDHLSPAAFENEVKAHIKNHTICRRFEIHDLPAPTLMNIFQRSIESAQRMMFGTEHSQELPPSDKRFQDSWRIRVVIDDLNGVRNTYLEVRDDPLLLPSLLFMFGREGVTSLIIDTQSSGSPELPITERFDSSVRELVQTRIYTWRLPFYGENRVAISVIPPISHEYRGLIRELHWETKDENKMDRALTVDPHFELYMGLEKAQPQPVPLEVRLYADTPSVEKYIATEEKLLREIFTPVLKNNDEPRVIAPAQVNEYEALRDACHVQRDTKLDHTTILQVNEFWWLRRPRQRRAGAFRPQWNYLNSVTATFKGKGKEYCSEAVVDPFWVFQPSPSKLADSSDKKADLKRRHFFDPDCGYYLETTKEEERHYVDRVPYTWDFGFLLCNGKAWEEAAAEEEAAAQLEKAKVSKVKKVKAEALVSKVKNVWDALCKATQDSSQANAKNSQKHVSWRDFLEASKIVAEFQSYRTSASATAFDFTMLIPESFSCLILEMWLSEAHDALKKHEEKRGTSPEKSKHFKERRERLKERVGTRRWYSNMPARTLLDGLQLEQGKSLGEILEMRTHQEVLCFSLELYKVWLLLTEAINFAELVDSSSHLNFEFKSRDVSSNAVSARHWYKTASKFVDSLRPEQLEYNWVPVRLPGHFSVRADWFLAVAGGSRSSRLADHALDLLSSQRSNVTRLQEGIGLPTRRLFDTDYKAAMAGMETVASHLRTRLISVPKKGEPLANVEYDVLKRIGAYTSSTNEEFYWLWRSGIFAYNRHSRIWHKWLNRALLWWHSRRQRYGSDWKNGFDVYDLLTDIEFSGDKKLVKSRLKEFDTLDLDSWKEFHKLRDILIAELEQVSISTS